MTEQDWQDMPIDQRNALLDAARAEQQINLAEWRAELDATGEDLSREEDRAVHGWGRLPGW